MSDVLLSADEHFERLREAVWHRLCARDGFCTRERFDEAYAEWWARELERAADGRPSRVSAPVAFVAESVHRVLIDDARARARGLARDEKGALEIVDLDSQVDAAAAQTTADEATYEALVHRILTLVQGELTARERRVFVHSYLYLFSTPETASALDLSLPRVKKDREKIARKVGERVWEVLSGELDLCATYDRKSLAAIFDLLAVHVEDCPTCAAALGGVRRGALAVVPPAEAVLLTGAGWDGVSQFVESLAARFTGVAHRVSESMASMPPGGRTAAAVAVAASAVAGGAVTVTQPPDRPARAQERQVRKPAATPTRVAQTASAPTATATAVSTPTAVTLRPAQAVARAASAAAAAERAATRRRRAARQRRERRRAAATGTREPLGFEQQAAAVPTGAPSSGSVVTSSNSASAPVRSAPAAPAPTASAPAAGTEFGFEGP